MKCLRFSPAAVAAAFSILAACGTAAQNAPVAGQAAPASDQPARAAGPSALERGWAAFQVCDFPAAMNQATEALKSSPSDPAALELSGRSAMAMGAPQRALPVLAKLAESRGTLQDYRLLALGQEMAGDAAASRAALERAETAKEPTAAGLYALAWEKPDAAGRLALLRRIAKDFPATAPTVAPEATFWEARPSGALRAPAAPLPPSGVEVKLKTLYNAEWAVATVNGDEELWLMIDTAARQTVLSKDTARRLSLPVVQASFPLPGSYPQEAAPAYTCLNTLALGSYKVAHVPALVVEDASMTMRYREGRAVLKGILGMDLLRGMKVRFDRQKNVLRLLPGDASAGALLDGKPAEWAEFPAFSVHDQVFVTSTFGSKGSFLGLLATGCYLVLAREDAMAGTGLTADSRNATNISDGNLVAPYKPVSEMAAGQSQNRGQVLGWLEACMPGAGRIRTIPKDATIGFGPAKAFIVDLPLYPFALGDEVPAVDIVGKKLTDFYAIALDLPAGKIYLKQVLFKK